MNITTFAAGMSIVAACTISDYLKQKYRKNSVQKVKTNLKPDTFNPDRLKSKEELVELIDAYRNCKNEAIHENIQLKKEIDELKKRDRALYGQLEETAKIAKSFMNDGSKKIDEIRQLNEKCETCKKELQAERNWHETVFKILNDIACDRERCSFVRQETTIRHYDQINVIYPRSVLGVKIGEDAYWLDLNDTHISKFRDPRSC